MHREIFDGEIQGHYRLEYRVCSGTWRYLGIFRYAAFASGTFLLSALYFEYQILSVCQSDHGSLVRAITLGGMFLAISLFAIEEHLRSRQHVCLERLLELERHLELAGHFTNIAKKQVFTFVWTTRLFYSMIELGWLYLTLRR